MTLAAHYLAALGTPQLGVTRLKRLVTACGGLEPLLSGARPDHQPDQQTDRARLEGLLPKIGASTRESLPAAQRAVAEARARGLWVSCWEDADYPLALLQDEAGCAPVLFGEGELPHQVLGPPEDLMACAVVGTRRASAHALGFARDLGRAAARHGLTVVSGLALGIDAAAHEGALEATGAVGPTVAVLGGGHGRLHPAANRGLATRIVQKGGSVISEWPPLTNPQPHYFLRRNRVIAGLSRVVAVIEAGKPSGALNTATHAAELGRDVLSVPGRRTDERSRGALELLREGAGLLLEVDDLLQPFGVKRLAEVVEWPATRGRIEPSAAPGTIEPSGAAGTLDSSAPPATAAIRTALELGGEVALDALSSASGLPASELLPVLGMLELEGLVERTASGRFRWRS